MLQAKAILVSGLKYKAMQYSNLYSYNIRVAKWCVLYFFGNYTLNRSSKQSS